MCCLNNNAIIGMGSIGDGGQEGTCDEAWVLYMSVETLYSTPETNTTLYVNYWNLKRNLEEKTKQNKQKCCNKLTCNTKSLSP